MNPILVSGLINLETTLRVDAFPIQYAPVHYPFFGVHSTVSGVGYNVARALTTLGDTVHLASLIGRDPAARLAQEALARDGIPDEFIVQGLEHTPQSVILYDGGGRRQINVDLKDIQEQVFPQALFQRALGACSLAVLCNINFSRPFLRLARREGKLVVTDVHAISNLEDEYNRDFMQAADVLFMSDECLPCPPREWTQEVLGRYGNEIIVVGLGDQGALLAVKSAGFIEQIPAVQTRQVVNTIGAGDALFSAFVHFYNQNRNPYQALKKAVVFASYKIGETGAAAGFLDEARLNKLCAKLG
jgi:sugar/nucleoside kinase (ribokinase family)